VTGRSTRVLAGLLGRLAGLLPEGRRDWAEAVLAEVGEIPAGSAQATWLGGGLWMVAREVMVARVIQVLALAAGAAGLVWMAWPGESSNSATPVNRMYVTGTVVMLAVLPWVVRRIFGPARRGWLPLAARMGGYTAVLALVAAKAVKDRDGSKLGAYFAVIPSIWVAEIVLLLVIGCYAAGLLILTSERTRVARSSLPVGVATGAVVAIGLYALRPLGDPSWWWWVAALPVPWAIGFAVARHSARDSRPGAVSPATVSPATASPATVSPATVSPATMNPATRGCLAAACAAATAALLLAVLTSATIALFPHHVPLEHPGPPPNGGCETCDPNSVVIPSGLRHEYWVEISVGQAGTATYAVLILGPLLGVAFGAAGAEVATRSRGNRGRTSGSDPCAPAPPEPTRPLRL
jgi:hypothetical protein